MDIKKKSGPNIKLGPLKRKGVFYLFLSDNLP